MKRQILRPIPRPLRRPTLPLLALSAGLAQVSVASAADEFQPFVWIDGTMTARAVYDDGMAPPDGTRSSFTIEHSIAFPPGGVVTADANESPLPLYPGFAIIEGVRVTDDAPEMAPPSVEAYEWRFAAFATADGLGDARFDALVDFEISEPVRVLIRAEFEGWGEVTLGDLSGWYGPSLTVVPSPLYHEEIILMPGVHTLDLDGGWLNYMGTGTDGAVDLLVRFEPTGCGPADLNADGSIDNADIQSFLGLFLAGDLRSDLTGDGILDNGDLYRFVEAFLEGCAM